MPRERSRYHDRRSSSSESNSSRGRKQSKSKHRRRSRSRNQSESSHRRKRSSSRSRHKRRSYSRSLSRDRHESKSKRRSSRSRSKRSRRSLSREQSRTRSSSRARSKHNKSSKKSCRRSRSSSSRSSFDIGNITSQMFATDDLSELLDSLIQLTIAKKRGRRNPTSSKKPFPRKDNLDDTETKLEKAIKAAEAAGLTMTKIPTYEYKEVEIKEEMPTIHDRNLIDELNSDSFVPKTFTSSRNKKQSKNIVIDLDAQTVKVPDSESIVIKDDSIIDFDEIPPEEDLKEMWIKKLCLFRKKMLKGEL